LAEAKDGFVFVCQVSADRKEGVKFHWRTGSSSGVKFQNTLLLQPTANKSFSPQPTPFTALIKQHPLSQPIFGTNIQMSQKQKRTYAQF
jgi:hypothetical protein